MFLSVFLLFVSHISVIFSRGEQFYSAICSRYPVHRPALRIEKLVSQALLQVRAQALAQARTTSSNQTLNLPPTSPIKATAHPPSKSEFSNTEKALPDLPPPSITISDSTGGLSKSPSSQRFVRLRSFIASRCRRGVQSPHGSVEDGRSGVEGSCLGASAGGDHSQYERTP